MTVAMHQTKCPGCKSALHVPPAMLTQALRCTRCGTVMRVRTPAWSHFAKFVILFAIGVFALVGTATAGWLAMRPREAPKPPTDALLVTSLLAAPAQSKTLPDLGQHI